jgi:GntR family transcriptional regulator
MAVSGGQFMGAAVPLTIDKQSPMPLYAQVKEQLVRLLSSMAGKPHQQFFTDGQLIEMFGVSRTTVREAIRDLIQEGYLYRVRGVGTFLASPVRDRLDRLQSYFQSWTAQGKAVSVEVKTSRHMECPGWVAQLLMVAEGSKIFYVQRTRTADGIPIASDYRYLPEEFARYVSVGALQSKTIFEILAEHVPADPPASARFTVQAAAASPPDARILGIPERAPVLVRTHLLISQKGRPMSVGKSVFRAELSKWSIELPVK